MHHVYGHVLKIPLNTVCSCSLGTITPCQQSSHSSAGQDPGQAVLEMAACRVGVGGALLLGHCRSCKFRFTPAGLGLGLGARDTFGSQCGRVQLLPRANPDNITGIVATSSSVTSEHSSIPPTAGQHGISAGAPIKGSPSPGPTATTPVTAAPQQPNGTSSKGGQHAATVGSSGHTAHATTNDSAHHNTLPTSGRPVTPTGARIDSGSPAADPPDVMVTVHEEGYEEQYRNGYIGNKAQPRPSSGQAKGTWSAIHTASGNSEEPIVEAYVVDGMHATATLDSGRIRGDSTSPSPGPNGSGQGPPGSANGAHEGAEAAQMALVLLGKPPNKKRSKGSKKMLKVLVKASTKFVDFVYSLPSYLVSKQQFLMVALAFCWYLVGAGLIGEAANKLATFLPETLQPPGFELLAAMGSVSQGLSDILIERFAHVFQGWTYASVLVKIPLVLTAAVPLVLTLSLVYHKVTGTPWEKALLKIHAVVHRQPGANMVSETTLPGFLLLNLSFFIGMFLVAVLFGLVSDEVKRSFRSIRDGNFPLRTNGHILILNYNQHVVPLLRQLWYGKKYSEDAFFSKPVVVMADKSKLEMDDEIASRLKIQSLDVYTRSGNPATTRDLGIVAAGRADTVIVLHPEKASNQAIAEASKAAIAMALSVAGKGTNQNVVMQMPNELPGTYDYMRSFAKTVEACKQREVPSQQASWQMSTTADSAANVQVLQMPDGNFMDRFTCHAALQPGVFRVWLRILQQGPANVKLRVKAVPTFLQGKNFAEVRRSFRDCLVVGYSKGGVDAVFDPADTQVLQATDKLVLLSYVTNPTPQPETSLAYRAAAKAASERMARPTTYQVAPRKVIVAGWNTLELQDMLECFADAAPENSQVTFILEQVPEDPSPPSRVGSIRFNYIQSDHPTCLKALTDAGIRQADAVLLGMHEELPATEADALVLAGLLQIQDAVLSSGRTSAPHVVARVQRYGTMQVIQQYYSGLNARDSPAASQIAQSSKPAGKSQSSTGSSGSNSSRSKSSSHLQRTPNKFENFFTLPKEVLEEAAAEVAHSSCTACKASAQDTSSSGTTGSQSSGKDLGCKETGSNANAAAGGSSGGASANQGASAAASKAANQPGKEDKSSSVDAGAVLGTAQLSRAWQSSLLDNWGATWALTASLPSFPESVPSLDFMNSMTPAMLQTVPAGVGAGLNSGPAPASGKQSTQAAAKQQFASSGSASLASSGSTAVLEKQGGCVDGSSTGKKAAASEASVDAGASSSSSAGHTGSSSSSAGGVQSSSMAMQGGAAAGEKASQSSGKDAGTSVGAGNASSAGSSHTHSSGGAASSTAGSGGPAPNTNAQQAQPTAHSHSHSSHGQTAHGSSGTVKKMPKPPLIRDPEVFLSDDISAALLALVSAHPDVTLLIRQLLTTRQGVELYLRTPALFNIAQGERVTFAEVAEVARLLKSTALGYMKADGSIILVPEPEHVFTYQEGDQIIVFADDFKKRDTDVATGIISPGNFCLSLALLWARSAHAYDGSGLAAVLHVAWLWSRSTDAYDGSKHE